MVAKKNESSSVDITQHILVPKHEVLSKKEVDELFETYTITVNQLPKIKVSDPGIRGLGAKPGDVVKITRKSLTTGNTVFYRGVISE